MQAFFLIGSPYARSRTASSRLEQPRLRLAAVVDGLLAVPIARTLGLLGIAAAVPAASYPTSEALYAAWASTLRFS
jgi:hypothetical protein